MIRVNTVFEVVRKENKLTAYSDKTASYEFLNGPSGTGIVDLYTPEIGAVVLKDPLQTQTFDDFRVTSILNEINGYDHSHTNQVGVPTLFGMNFQAINAAKKDSLGGGYSDDFGTPNATLQAALQHTDASIGQMLAGLSANGLRDTTAIILTAKHAESSIDPSLRVIDLTTAIQNILTPAGFPATVIPKITEKTAALIWLKNQSQTQSVANVLTLKINEQALHIQQMLVGESLKLLFPDPLTDPAPPDIILIPANGTNFEPSANASLPAVQAEHGGFNENETHVPLVVSFPAITPSQNRAPVTTSQIAPSILALLGLNPGALDAVNIEGVTALPGIPSKGADKAH
jgi:Sulfatase.